jgi:DNA excision repair protein ERCC-2
MEDLRRYGRDKIQCPYYTAREGLKVADIIVFNYLYLIDPQISGSFLKNLSKDTIVVFDEAHNIDDVCIEAYTLKVNNQVLANAGRNINGLQDKIRNLSEESVERYKAELKKVSENLKLKEANYATNVNLQ